MDTRRERSKKVSCYIILLRRERPPKGIKGPPNRLLFCALPHFCTEEQSEAFTSIMPRKDLVVRSFSCRHRSPARDTQRASAAACIYAWFMHEIRRQRNASAPSSSSSSDALWLFFWPMCISFHFLRKRPPDPKKKRRRGEGPGPTFFCPTSTPVLSIQDLTEKGGGGRRL